MRQRSEVGSESLQNRQDDSNCTGTVVRLSATTPKRPLTNVCVCVCLSQAMVEQECVGAIVCKLDMHKKMFRRGYIAMLAVDSKHRRKSIGEPKTPSCNVQNQQKSLSSRNVVQRRHFVLSLTTKSLYANAPFSISYTLLS